MKKLVLRSLIALAATQAGGCIISSGGSSNDAHITAAWSFRNVATNTAGGCPGGQFDTAALYTQATDSTGLPIGSCTTVSDTCFIDLFNCSDGAGTSSGLPPTNYIAWVEIANHDGSQVYAQSVDDRSPDGLTHLDVTDVDVAETFEILNDGGYFSLAWDLVRESNGATLACSDVAGIGGVDAIGTDISSSTNSNSDIFTCGDGQGVTAPYVAATYSVQVRAIDGSNPPKSLGDAPDLNNKVIGPQSQVTSLGTVTIPIAGL